MQGENFSSILCTSSLDRISTECPLEPYKFRNSVNIPKMGFLDDMADITVCGLKTKLMTQYTNEEVAKRKLQFSSDKCRKFHVGKKYNNCEQIKIDQWEVTDNLQDKFSGSVQIQETNSYIYLGEILTPSGSNKMNIASKISKCIGKRNDILFILNNTYYGDQYFNIAKLLRNSMFLSVLTGNCEVWPRINLSDIKLLESADNTLMYKILESPSKSSYVLMLLEGGLWPVPVIVKSRRLGYLHNLLNKEDGSLSKLVFQKTRDSPIKQDWINLVLKDLKDLNICLSFEEIEQMSKS